MLSCRQTLAGQLGVCLCCFCLVESSGWALIRVLVDRGMMLPLQQLLLSSAFATSATQIYQQRLVHGFAGIALLLLGRYDPSDLSASACLVPLHALSLDGR